MSKKFKTRICDLINSYSIVTPIGELKMVSCPLGLHELTMRKVNKDLIDEKDRLLSTKQDIKCMADLSLSHSKEIYEPVSASVTYFQQYFYPDCEDDIELPPICWKSVCAENTFTEKVLKNLFENVKIGEKVSYKQLALLAGNVKAARAVGSAMRKNPIMLIIPCHRVIKSDENIGNYSGGGVSVKNWLLNHESNLK